MFWTKKDKEEAEAERKAIVTALESLASQVSYLAHATSQIVTTLQSLATLVVEIHETQAAIIEHLYAEATKEQPADPRKKSEKLN
jgi:ABC-type transporter Mla subunit MlaD